jgi:predicted extracellular nuclease
VAEGNIVSVTGLQQEFFALSELDASGAGGNVSVIDSGDNLGLITAAAIDLPAPAGTDQEATFEQYEGMLVEFVNELTATEYFELPRFGQLVLSGDGKQRQFTDANPPSVTGFADHQEEIARNRIILDDLNNVQNIDPVYHLQPGGFSVANFFRGGDTVTALSGILEWSFGDWRVRPQQSNPVGFNAANPRTDTPQNTGGSIKVAAFNVLNYFRRHLP